MISYSNIVKTGSYKKAAPTNISVAASSKGKNPQSTPTTQTASTVSSLTSDDVKRTIERQNEKTTNSFKQLLQEELLKQKKQTDDAISRISNRMDQLETSLESLQKTMAQTVAQEINSKFLQLEEKMNTNYVRLEETFKQTLETFITKVQGSGSPNRKKTRTDSFDSDSDLMQE